MTRASHRLRRAAAVTAAAALPLAAVALPAPAAAASTCGKHHGELARKGSGVVWHDAKSLFVCTAYYGDPAVQKRVGPWTKQSRVAFDGSTVVWTERRTGGDGIADDRVWAADGPYATWLSGVRPATGPAAFLDGRVRTLIAYGDAAAWVTRGGQVMMAVHSPDENEAAVVGAGTPGAAAPVVPGVTDAPGLSAEDLLSYPQGLLSPLKAQGRRVLLGRWSALDNKALAATLKVRDTGRGDGDECGGVTEYEATVRPVAGQPRVGATWSSDWTSTSRACNF